MPYPWDQFWTTILQVGIIVVLGGLVLLIVVAFAFAIAKKYMELKR